MEKELRKIMLIDNKTRQDLIIKLTSGTLDFLYWLKAQVDCLDELEIYAIDTGEYDYVEDVE